ncbi:MAG: endonuclease [Planctomycetes bacterium]|nr:endonuclease [Planctomycetota bacterium]
MTPEELRELLCETLDDRRLSRSEKKAVGRILERLAPDARELVAYRSAAFDVAREAAADPHSRETLDWLEDVLRVLEAAAADGGASVRSEAHFSPGDDCPERLRGLFAAARRSADVCVFTITDDRITSAILDAHRRGVRVRIVTDDDKSLDAGSDIELLARAGVPVRFDRSPFHMHHKFAVFDAALLVTGSYNWTRAAAEHNEENFILTGDPRLIEPFAELFERLWKAFG